MLYTHHAEFFKNIYLFIWLCRALAAAHGLSCPTACGILDPRPGIEPASPALEGRFLITGPPGESHAECFILTLTLAASNYFRLYFLTNNSDFIT